MVKLFPCSQTAYKVKLHLSSVTKLYPDLNPRRHYSR